MKVEVLSVGGSLLFDGCEINYSYIKKLKKLLTSYSDRKFVVVIGGGSIARTYIDALKHFDTSNEFMCHFGIAITRTNARMMANAFGRVSNTRHLPKSLKQVKNLLVKHRVVFCGGLRYDKNQTSDGTAATIAHYFKTRFINVTNVDGLYNKDPMKNRGAKLIPCITYKEFDKIINKLKYRPGQHFILDQHASSTIKKYKIPTYVVGGNLNNLKKLLNGKKFVGTTIG